MEQGEWSDWIPLKFELMPLVASIHGMVRVYVQQVHPHFRLYMTPINVDPIGKKLGQYQIIEELGRGGMAVVYKAYQPSLNRYVAIKVLPPQFTFDNEFVQRFLREARAAAALRHPNIVTIHDVRSGGSPALGRFYLQLTTLLSGYKYVTSITQKKRTCQATAPPRFLRESAGRASGRRINRLAACAV